MSAVRLRLRRDEYRDSGTLMRVTRALEALEGVTRAAAIMATARNLEMLSSMELAPEDGALADARGSDLALVVEASSIEAAEAALARVDELLEGRERAPAGAPGQRAAVRSLDAAVERAPGANLAMISVPGPFAAGEARRALRRGLHVFLFSNGVSLEDEIDLKGLARERGLLMMGPDCGTAILDGVPVGFANQVRRGPVGVVGASGTGIQEVCALVHAGGSGVSHAIGTGGRDLSDDVGGATALAALERLEADPSTRVLLLVSKPPSARVAERVLARAVATGRPVVACFLGAEPSSGPGFTTKATLEEAAAEACRLAGATSEPAREDELGAPRFAPEQRHLRGLFSGGTLGYESLIVLSPALAIASNLHFRGVLPLEPSAGAPAAGHTVIDLGEDEFTRGRPHPMIDPTLRAEAIRRAGDDPDAAVVLLDLVLGFGAHPDPAGAIAQPIEDARAAATRRGGELVVIASVTGTDLDPQRRSAQAATLREAGATVTSSNAAAARLSLRVLQGLEGR